MKLFIIFAAVVASACASPVPALLHPSPVSPDVLVAIKPEEKIIMITDPMEIAKFKRETSHPFYPTELPKAIEHGIAKRQHSENGKAIGLQEPQKLILVESTEPKKHDIPVPWVPKHQHPEEPPNESSEIESVGEKKMENIEQQQVDKLAEQQQHKRDIPVPLVPKYHHPEESPKDSIEEEKHESVTAQDQTIPPTVEPKQEHVPKEGQQNSQVSSNGTSETLQQQKQESMIAANSQHESPKADKEVKTETSESSPSHNQHQVLPTDKITQEKLPGHHYPLNLKANQYHSVHTTPDQNQTISVWYHDLHIDKKAETNEYNPVVPNANNENVSLPKLIHTHIFNAASNPNDQKPNIQNDNLSASEATTQHHLARPHPVPVAELFAKRNR